jgi:hypothetical protein
MLLRHTFAGLLGVLLFAGCAPTYPCGDTQCGEGQACISACARPYGPPYVRYSCEDLPDDCTDCDCLDRSRFPICVIVDGHPNASRDRTCPRSAN